MLAYCSLVTADIGNFQRFACATIMIKLFGSDLKIKAPCAAYRSPLAACHTRLILWQHFGSPLTAHQILISAHCQRSISIDSFCQMPKLFQSDHRQQFQSFLGLPFSWGFSSRRSFWYVFIFPVVACTLKTQLNAPLNYFAICIYFVFRLNKISHLSAS